MISFQTKAIRALEPVGGLETTRSWSQNHFPQPLYGLSAHRENRTFMEASHPFSFLTFYVWDTELKVWYKTHHWYLYLFLFVCLNKTKYLFKMCSDKYFWILITVCLWVPQSHLNTHNTHLNLRTALLFVHSTQSSPLWVKLFCFGVQSSWVQLMGQELWVPGFLFHIVMAIRVHCHDLEIGLTKHEHCHVLLDLWSCA